MSDDNKLKFTTELDTNPAIKAAKELYEKIKSAAEKSVSDPGLKELQGNLKTSLPYIKSLNQQLKTSDFYENRIAEANAKITALAEKRAAVATAQGKVDAAQKQIASLQADYYGKWRGRESEPGAIKNRANLKIAENNLKDYNKELTVAIREQDKLEASIQRDVNAISNMEAKSESFVNQFSLAGVFADNIENNVTGLGSAFEEVSSASKEVTDNTKEFGESAKAAGDSASEAFNQIKEQIDNVGVSAKDAADTAQEAFSGTKLDLNADASQMSLLELISRYRQIKDEMKALEAVKDPTKEQGQRYHELNIALYDTTNAINNMKTAYKGITQETGEVTLANRSLANSFKLFSESFVSISQAQGLLGKVKAGISALGPAAMEAGLLSKEALTMATSGINLVIEVVARLATIIQTVLGAFKTLASSIVNAFKKVLSTLKKVASELKDNIVKTAERTKKAFNGMFSFSGTDLKRTLQMLTKYIFGVRSFFFLYRKLRGAIKDGLENLVQFESESNQTNTAITELRTSLLYLKNAWAAAFAPIINVVYPILVKFMDILATIGNTIARFVGALTGQRTVLQALKVDAGDYADSLKSAGGSAKKAADAQEDLNDRLAAFDDLNVLGVDKDKDTSPSGGGGGGGDDLIPSIDDMFERVNVKMTKFMQVLREAWSTGEGFELGQILAKSLDNALDNAHAWLTGEGREKIVNIAHFIGTTMDGVLSDGELAGKIGQVLSDVFIDAMLFINEVITPDRMYMIGLRLAQMFNTAIPQIVPELGKTLGNLFKSAIKGMWGFISNADFAEWGKSVGDAINNFLTQMSGASGKGVKGTLSGWQLLGMSITEWAEQILDFFISAIEQTDWQRVGEAIKEFLGSIRWDDVKAKLRVLWQDVWKALGEVFPEGKGTFDSVRSIFDGIFMVLGNIKNAIAEIDWTPILNGISTIIEKLAKTDWNEVGENLGNIVSKIGELIPKIADGVSDLADKLGEIKDDVTGFLGSGEFVTTVILVREEFERTGIALKNIFDILGGIISISANWDPLNLTGGKDTGNDSGGILTFLREIQSFSFGSLASEFAPVINGIIGFRNMFSNFDKIKSDFESVVSFISEHLGILTSNFGLSGTELSLAFSLIGGGFGDLISDFTSGQISLDEVFGLITGNFLDWDEIRTNFEGIVSGIVEKIDELIENFTGIPDALSGLPSRFRSAFNDVIDVVNDFFSRVTEGRNTLVNVLGSMGGISGAAAAFASSGTISFTPIPHLAQGAVIPPNREFMAVLGDQSHGTNIEAPLDTIQQAVGDTLTPYLEQLIEINAQVINAINNKNLTIGDREIGKANARYVNQQKLIRGTML